MMNGERQLLDTGSHQEWERMLYDTPDDPILIRLYALRTGLRRMIDDGLVCLAIAADIFERERARAVIERHGEMQELKAGSG